MALERSDAARRPPFGESRATLYASPALDIFVIDIPASIAAAQAHGDATRALASCAPLREPYASLEPRTSGKRAALEARGDVNDRARKEAYASLIRGALERAKSRGGVERFCGPRYVPSHLICRERLAGSKRGSDGGAASMQRAHGVKRGMYGTADEELDGTLRRMAVEDGRGSGFACRGTIVQSTRSRARGPTCETDAGATGSGDANEDGAASCGSRHGEAMSCSGPIVNDAAGVLRLRVPTGAASLQFDIPPRSAALNRKLVQSPASMTALAAFCPQSLGRFPMILLDPPWPNRSARRKASYQTYKRDGSAASLQALMDLLTALNIGDHLLPDGVMAIWITNRSVVRKSVLDFFAQLGVELVEEWIWAKVTETGEPVSEVQGLWRQPWEVLLIGRHTHRSGEDEYLNAHTEPEKQVKRRVICAVPDLHSRKPCLKELFECLLFKPGTQCLDDRTSVSPVLEVFARHMVSDWFSWGDEALKYQWDGWWGTLDSGM